MRYGELCGALGREGLALHNMASLPHITVVGAVVTATHGSGDRSGNLATGSQLSGAGYAAPSPLEVIETVSHRFSPITNGVYHITGTGAVNVMSNGLLLVGDADGTA